MLHELKFRFIIFSVYLQHIYQNVHTEPDSLITHMNPEMNQNKNYTCIYIHPSNIKVHKFGKVVIIILLLFQE